MSKAEFSHFGARYKIEGVKEADQRALWEFLQQQAEFNQLCAEVVRKRQGLSAPLRFDVPTRITFRWQGYALEAMEVRGEILISSLRKG